MKKTLSVLIALFCIASAVHAQDLAFPQVFKKVKLNRPIYLLPMADGSDRIVIAEQAGRVLIIDNENNTEKTHVALDMTDRIFSPANGGFNEEGLLGMAFHPKFKENRQVFVHYSIKEPRGNIVSRFTMKDDDTVDRESEEEIMRIKQPYFNHNGGSIEFGPDGFLYIALGDGGAANDPKGHGQNLKTLLAAILRIDVDHAPEGKTYSIPKDNPFIDKPGARPEIYAYGLRNVWRMSFDRETGALWAGDVGQNLWEEIDIIKKGGNYGWNIIEGTHFFNERPQGKSDKLPQDYVPPVAEVNHNLAKSITGGYVYRGKQVPNLVGKYIYADYQTGLIWIMEYDVAKENLIQEPLLIAKLDEIASFGEDRDGEIYIVSLQGKIWKVTGNQ